jgi:hypothetical protein
LHSLPWFTSPCLCWWLLTSHLKPQLSL